MTDEFTHQQIIAEQWHIPMARFHAKEAAKYRAKAEAAEAKGKTKAAARAWKVVERNERLAAKHESAGS